MENSQFKARIANMERDRRRTNDNSKILTSRLTTIISQQVGEFFSGDGDTLREDENELDDIPVTEFIYPIPNNWPFAQPDRNNMVFINSLYDVKYEIFSSVSIKFTYSFVFLLTRLRLRKV